MVLRIRDGGADYTPVTYAYFINTSETDAIAEIPGVFDVWLSDDALVQGQGDVSTLEWIGYQNARRIRHASGASIAELISGAMRGKPALRTGYGGTGEGAGFNGGTYRSKLVSDDNILDGGSYALFSTVLAPAGTTPQAFLGTAEVSDGVRVGPFGTGGGLRFYQRYTGTLAATAATDIRGAVPYLIAEGWSDEDDEYVVRINGVEVARATVSVAPYVDNTGQITLGGFAAGISGATFEGYLRGFIPVVGRSLMQSADITGFTGGEDEALRRIEQFLMEDVGLPYPG